VTWRPILDGDDLARARAVVAATVAAVPEPRWEDGDDVILVGGETGVALMLAYAARVSPDLARVDQVQQRVVDLLERGPPRAQNLYFWTGLTGIAWAVEHAIAVLDPGRAPDDGFADLDDAVLELLAEPGARSFELYKGITGLAVYALDRLPAPRARCCIERAVRVLVALATRDREGACWRTEPAFLPPRDRAPFASGYRALGVAHGSAGPIAILGAACARGIAADIAGPLLDAALAWLWGQALVGRAQRFPAIAESREPAVRTAWCHGDPGIASIAFGAARAAGLTARAAQALQLARDVARRAPDTCGIDDPMFCHGATGLAHMLNRFHHWTGEPEFRDAARAWFRAALDMWRPGRGISTGLLDGSAGAALALLAASSDVEPGWDRAFLLSGARVGSSR
jgi:hypothetical protein